MNDPILIQRAVKRVAEQRIQEAMERGAFDNLPGAGEPIRDLDEPYDQLWWVKRWMKREDLESDRLRGELDRTRS